LKDALAEVAGKEEPVRPLRRQRREKLKPALAFIRNYSLMA